MRLVLDYILQNGPYGNLFKFCADFILNAPGFSVASSLGQDAPFVAADRDVHFVPICAPSTCYSLCIASVLQIDKDNVSSPPPFTFVIVPDDTVAQRIIADILTFAPHAQVEHFVESNVFLGEDVSISADIAGRRFACLRKIKQYREEVRARTPFVLVLSIRSFIEKIPGVFADCDIPALYLERFNRYNTQDIAETLVAFGYKKTAEVSQRGEFAVRGGIVDIFDGCAAYPYRFDFFGSRIEEIREFSPLNQTSFIAEILESVTILPVSFSLHPFLHTAGADLLRAEHLSQREGVRSARDQEAAGRGGVMLNLIDCVLRQVDQEDLLLFCVDFPKCMQIQDQFNEIHRQTGIDQFSGFFNQNLPSCIYALLSQEYVPQTEFAANGSLSFGKNCKAFKIPDLSSLDVFASTAVIAFIQNQIAKKRKVLICLPDAILAKRCIDTLEKENIACLLIDTKNKPAWENEKRDDRMRKGSDRGSDLSVWVVVAKLSSGMLIGDLCILSASEFFGRSFRSYLPGVNHPQKRIRKSKRLGGAIDMLHLREGDLLVHDLHGIGRFVKVENRLVRVTAHAPQILREYLVIEYAPSKRGGPPDRLFIPADNTDTLSVYVGADAPKLSKIGGTDWAKAKNKAKTATKQIALSLAALYAKRVKTKGYAFSTDSTWQREFEDAFEYIETPDQLKAIEDIKLDMESARPMDRLLAGDVGFGKTEVAMRAAFKAVQDGKQVCVLAPTTLLVRQHLNTFVNRMKGYPINIRSVSRFDSPREIKTIQSGLAAGTIDIIIGTHRLLSVPTAPKLDATSTQTPNSKAADLQAHTSNTAPAQDKATFRFKDLGLLIIDEEHRFGVEHKEKLRALKVKVDVLSMSATPIPRTLEMVISGIRQMSQLSSPPLFRYPVSTFCGEYCEKSVIYAISRELVRSGQVFYIHNRTNTIDQKAQELAEMIPQAKIAVAHAKLPAHELEDVMLDFFDGRFDVLVSTTIVESGIDIPNVNTLIVEDAHRYGLSQLHQLRGRVGRGPQRAYAYFFHPPGPSLTFDASQRLDAIASHFSLGAGIEIAMQDLKLRGAGNILGAEQSGYIAGVGFDMYARMIQESIDELQNVPKVSEDEGKEGKKTAPDMPHVAPMRFELPISAHIPESYIQQEGRRLNAYKSIALCKSEAELKQEFDTLRDQFGRPPQEVELLYLFSKLKLKLKGLGILNIFISQEFLHISPVALPQSRKIQLLRMYPKSRIIPVTGTSAQSTIAASRLRDLPQGAELCTLMIPVEGKKISQLDNPESAKGFLDWIEGIAIG